MLKIPLRIYIILLLLLATAMSFALYKTTFKRPLAHFKPEKAIIAIEDDILEESMTGVQAWRFDQEGRLSQTVNMQSWQHYQDQPTSHIILPALKMYHQDGSLWDISAKTGESFQAHIHGKLEKLQLAEDVVVLRSTADQPAWELKTQHLLFLAKQPTAITDDAVIDNGPGMEIHATGLHADLEKHTIEFLKEVKTHYAKPQA